MKNSFKIVVYFLLFFVVFTMDVKALKVVTYGEFTNGTWGSGSGPMCYGNSYSCWNPDAHHNGFFRLTLIDKNGKKVDGTKSVNISGNSFYNASGNFKLYNYRSISTPNGQNGDYLSYKFNNGDLNDMTYISGNDVAIVYDSRFPIFSADLNYFVHNILENINIDCNVNSNQCFDGVSFYEYFLHLSGFLSNEDTLASIRGTQKFNDFLHYFVIIEPGYPVWWQSSALGGAMIYRYGTVNEWAQYIKNNPSSLVATTHKYHLFSNAGACVSDINQIQKLHDEYGFSAELNASGICNSGNTSVDDFISKAYGVSISFPLTSTITIPHPDPDPEPDPDPKPNPNPDEKIKFRFIINFCDQNSGKLTFLNYYDIEKNPLVLKNGNINIVGRDADDNMKIYCYDDVEYDFSETLDDLKKINLAKYSFVNPRTSKINVTRHCLIGSAAEYGIADVQNDIDSFKNAKLRIKYYDNDVHVFSTEDKPIEITMSPVRKINDYRYVTFTFSLNFMIPNNSLFIGDKSGLMNGYIELSNWQNSFGRSNPLLSIQTAVWDKKYVDNNTALPTNEAMQCHFSFNIPNIKSNINFRVISLENPFPARNGSSRMPSENWLYTENNVFNYITNNRGIRSISKSENVSPEDMYSQTEPMYTVTLTPSVMMDIRSYNKDFSYYSMFSTAENLTDGNKKLRSDDAKADKLQCSNNGRECISTYLRKLSEKTSIGGACFLNKDELDSYNGNKFTALDLNTLYTIIYVSKNNKYAEEYIKYDLNKNFRVDSEDYELLNNYLKNDDSGIAQDNSRFYTCANKTYKSGGPVEEENK